MVMMMVVVVRVAVYWWFTVPVGVFVLVSVPVPYAITVITVTTVVRHPIVCHPIAKQTKQRLQRRERRVVNRMGNPLTERPAEVEKKCVYVFACRTCRTSHTCHSCSP